jgi:hypothetical protein
MLCRQHLLGEHRELHVLWSIMHNPESKSPWRHHPETKRWVPAQVALLGRHLQQVLEMERRGYTHKSPLEYHPFDYDSFSWPPLRRSLEEEIAWLRSKGCDCQHGRLPLRIPRGARRIYVEELT